MPNAVTALKRECFREIAFQAVTCHYYYNELEYTDSDDHSTIRMRDQCGNAFISKGMDDIFCSEECRDKFNRNKKK